jgi:hypothetical protein
LALAGPLGWAIGGGALVTAGLLSNSKNKKAAYEALEKAKEIRKAIRILDGTNEEIIETNKLTFSTEELLQFFLNLLTRNVEQYQYDFDKIARLDNRQLLKDLGTLVNNMKSAAQLLNRPIGAKG